MTELPPELKEAEVIVNNDNFWTWERKKAIPSSVVASFLEENDVTEAVAFFKHLKNHPEVKTALVHAGMPVCKICGKSSKEIVFGGERK